MAVSYRSESTNHYLQYILPVSLLLLEVLLMGMGAAKESSRVLSKLILESPYHDFRPSRAWSIVSVISLYIASALEVRLASTQVCTFATGLPA